MYTELNHELSYLFTARKQSLGQGNIFRSVCQEFCPRGGSTWAGTPPQVGPGTPPSRPGTPPRTRYPPPGAVHAGRYGQQAGGTHPTGMHSFYLCKCKCTKIILRTVSGLSFSKLLIRETAACVYQENGKLNTKICE